ncbi:MAG: xylulokinase [Ornithinimicrobium sp.]|uniref:xylulokinase n=1 Tax=Ornithinimicrobium sp. TaxID=1977084 RepID=UPI0026DF245F|nr:xylulokinase [Ornithinimicrobium sp.]MDO5738795.1 xylulokinase [Ornithinimicrobium sp.]
MSLVAGIDSSTQACKVEIRDAASGTLLRSGRAGHPDGTEVDPEAWWVALGEAVAQAGGLRDVSAVSVAGQQHGMVLLDEDGAVLREAILWNDTRSAPDAEQLRTQLGEEAWVERTGSVPLASYTVTKLAWLSRHEPAIAARVRAVALPHDWLTWRLRGCTDLLDLVTDRSDASGTGYWSPKAGTYDRGLLELALGHDAALPRVAAPSEALPVRKGSLFSPGTVIGAGAGDNAAAALGLGIGPGQVVMSVGTSGVVSACSPVPASDASGLVSGFADATGRYLPLACTLNGARVMDGVARLLGVDHQQLSELALSVPAGADGLVLVPYLEGERTPNLPTATGALHGITLATLSPAHLARAAADGISGSLAVALGALQSQGVQARRIFLIGGAAASAALRDSLATMLGLPLEIPPAAEYVARGAARQAAWALASSPEPPPWEWDGPAEFTEAGTGGEAVLERYRAAADLHLDRIGRAPDRPHRQGAPLAPE